MDKYGARSIRGYLAFNLPEFLADSLRDPCSQVVGGLVRSYHRHGCWVVAFVLPFTIVACKGGGDAKSDSKVTLDPIPGDPGVPGTDTTAKSDTATDSKTATDSNTATSTNTEVKKAPPPGGNLTIVGTVALDTTGDVTAVALPVTSGVIDVEAMVNPPQAAVAGGHLVLEIPDGSNLALNEQAAAAPATQVIAVFEEPSSKKRMDLIDTIKFIEMPVAGSDSLVGLPVASAKSNEIALGTIQADGSGKVVATTTANDAVFDFTDAEL